MFNVTLPLGVVGQHDCAEPSDVHRTAPEQRDGDHVQRYPMLRTQVAGTLEFVQRPELAGVVEVRVKRVAADVIDTVALAEFKCLRVGGTALGADVHTHRRQRRA